MESEFGKVDPYNCLKFDCRGLTDTEPSRSFIERGLERHGSGLKAAWIHLSQTQLHLVSVCVELGFALHHCSSDNSITLLKWLRTSPSNVPEYSNHYIGVGGAVIDDHDNILVVQTTLQSLEEIPWKLPGGYVETRESLGVAAVREVKEETGVDAEVIGLLCFREISSAPFGRRDIYFVMLMRPLCVAIQVQDTHEVMNCSWIPMPHFLEVSAKWPACQMLKAMCHDISTNFRAELSPKTMKNIGQEWGLRTHNDPKYWVSLRH
jgi:ADP-ribose pyrophosphatase YjhB (NUDIX family)